MKNFGLYFMTFENQIPPDPKSGKFRVHFTREQTGSRLSWYRFSNFKPHTLKVNLSGCCSFIMGWILFELWISMILKAPEWSISKRLSVYHRIYLPWLKKILDLDDLKCSKMKHFQTLITEYLHHGWRKFQNLELTKS